MNPSGAQSIIEEAKLILAGVVQLREEVAEFRRESKENFAEINATFDRIDHHINDITAILTKANRALPEPVK